MQFIVRAIQHYVVKRGLHRHIAARRAYHHAPLHLELARAQPLHRVRQSRGCKLGHEAHVADIDSQHRHVVPRRRLSRRQYGTVAAQYDNHVAFSRHLVDRKPSALAQRICQRRVQNRLHIAALRKLYHAACHAESMRLARIPVYADAFNHCISLLSYTVYSTLHKHTSHFAFFNLLFAYQ